jgi:hypothetical protein
MQSETETLKAVVADQQFKTAAVEVASAEALLTQARAHLQAAIELLTGQPDAPILSLAKAADAIQLTQARLFVLRVVPMSKEVRSPL